MRLNNRHIKYISSKIAVDLQKSGKVFLVSGIDVLVPVIEECFREDLESENILNAEVRKIIDANEDDINFYNADEKQLFRMIKNRIAREKGIVTSFNDRYSNLSFNIFEKLYQEDLINYKILDNQVKNIIFSSIKDYFKQFDDLDDAISQKISTLKKKVIYGTPEYDILFDKLFTEELVRRGII